MIVAFVSLQEVKNMIYAVIKHVVGDKGTAGSPNISKISLDFSLFHEWP